MSTKLCLWEFAWPWRWWSTYQPWRKHKQFNLRSNYKGVCFGAWTSNFAQSITKNLYFQLSCLACGEMIAEERFLTTLRMLDACISLTCSIVSPSRVRQLHGWPNVCHWGRGSLRAVIVISAEIVSRKVYHGLPRQCSRILYCLTARYLQSLRPKLHICAACCSESKMELIVQLWICLAITAKLAPTE